MSNASVGTSPAIVALIELNPMIVYSRARALVARRPETRPVVTEIARSYGRVLDQLEDDYAILDRHRQ